MGSIFVTLSTLAYATLAPEHTNSAAGLYNLARSLGISIAVTWYSRFGQADWIQLGGHINPFNPALQQWLQTTGLRLSDPTTVAILTNELGRQASMLAFTQVFSMIALTFVLMLPLSLLLKGGKRGH